MFTIAYCLKADMIIFLTKYFFDWMTRCRDHCWFPQQSDIPPAS